MRVCEGDEQSGSTFVMGQDDALSSVECCWHSRAMPSNPPSPTHLRLRILFGDDAMLGPGKADLLQRIRDTGSISAAGRAMGMSYKRAWGLVEEMNRAFRDPLVESNRGGATGGGATLTPAGDYVLALYRQIQDKAARSCASEMNTLRAMLGDMSERK